MKWFQDQDKVSVLFLIASVAVHCSVGWRVYASYHSAGSLWPVISVGSLYNKYETAVLALSLFVGLLLTTRHIRKSGLKTKWTLLFVSMVLLGSFIIGSHAVIWRSLAAMQNRTPFVEKYLSELEKFVNDPKNRLGDRSQISEIIASGKFVKTGEISKFLDRNGQIRTYDPTLEDKIIRHGEQRLKDSVMPAFRRNMFVWSGFLLIPIMAGLLVPIKKELA